MRWRSPLALLLVVVAAGCGGSGGSGVQHPPASPYRGVELSGRAPNLVLHDQNGKTVTLAAARGHWVVVTFLYTTCPDVCPVIAEKLNAALQTPVGKQAGLRVLAVSVDPAHDTAAAVRRYVTQRRLLPAFSYLIGSRAQLARVWHAYHVAVLAGPKHTVTHSTVEYLIDPQGKERLIYDRANVSNLTDDVVHDLGKLGVS